MKPEETEPIARRITDQVAREAFRVTQHAQQEMAAEDIVLSDVLEALSGARILENYPDHRRGACCLVCGYTRLARPLHIVCTTAQPHLILITVYEPKPPKWVTPTQRRIRP